MNILNKNTKVLEVRLFDLFPLKYKTELRYTSTLRRAQCYTVIFVWKTIDISAEINGLTTLGFDKPSILSVVWGRVEWGGV